MHKGKRLLAIISFRITKRILTELFRVREAGVGGGGGG